MLNEYAFTFVMTVVSVLVKSIYSEDKTGRFLKSETMDFGPELILISISFAASGFVSNYQSGNPAQAIVLKAVLVLLLGLLMLVALLKRIVPSEKRTLLNSALWPLMLGVGSLFVVLMFTR